MKNHVALFFTFIILLALVAGCTKTSIEVKSLEDLHHASIGVATGTTGEATVLRLFPEARLSNFDNPTDAIPAIKNHQIDAFITSKHRADNVVRYNSDLTYLPEIIQVERNALAVHKNNHELLEKLNMVIAEFHAKGIFEEMYERWFLADPSSYEPLQIDVPKTGEEIKIGTTSLREPFMFIGKDQKLMGFEHEFAQRLAVRLNLKPVFVDSVFSALILSLNTGRINVIMANMTPTEERKEHVSFTEPYFDDAQVVLIRKNQP